MLEHISENKRNLFDTIIENRTRHITVVLENLYQPHNASAVLRSCDCFGVQDVHVIENTNKYELSKEVDMGSSKWVNVVHYNRTDDNTLECLTTLKEKGYRIIGTTPHKNDCLIHELPIDKPVALVYGTELTGMTETAMNACDGFVKLPMYGFTESYNISVSVALSLYDVTERMRKMDLDWRLSEEEKLATKLQWVRKVIKHSAKVEREIIARGKA